MSNLKWCVSLPPVAQYAKGHMFIFEADTAAELDSQFDEVLGGETVQKALDVAQLLTGASVVTEGLLQAVPASQNTSAPSEQSATVTQLRTCAHGKREYKTGGGGSTGKKVWAGYFCPEKIKANQCDVDWVRD